MLSTQVDLGTQTDILPTQNIGLLDQNQPRIYSLLENTNSPTTITHHRRKKAAKFDITTPVVVNPQITMAPRDINFAAPHQRSSMPSASVSPFVPTRHINGHEIPIRVYLGHPSYDANNNINNNHPTLPLSFYHSLPIQAQQIHPWLNGSLPIIHTNSIPGLLKKAQLFELNRSVNNNMNERTAASISSPQQNEHKHPNQSLPFIDQGSLLNHSHFISSPVPDAPTVKQKRKYTKRAHSSASVEQVQHSSPCPVAMTESTVPNHLPSIIPASVALTPPKSEEHPLAMDISTTSNFAPLTPPGSIKSAKSPPSTTVHDSSSISTQQLLPYTATNIAEMNSIPQQYFRDQTLSHIQKPNQELSTNHFSYNLHRFLPIGHSQYCIVPPNLGSTSIQPMTCSSILPGTISNIPSAARTSDIKKERKPREKGGRKCKVIQKPTIEKLADEQSSIFKSSTADTSIIRKRKHKKADMKDIQTKKQLRRITRRNRLAVLKFMIRKRKQEKQQLIPTSQLCEPKVEQVVPKLDSTHIVSPVKMERNLPDIIAPSLKITLDATQKIESISLYYHRRRKPDITNENSPKSLSIADNKLGLLLEALEFMETFNGSLKLAPTSNK